MQTAEHLLLIDYDYIYKRKQFNLLHTNECTVKLY
jgi:hypothetical protein